MLVDFVKPQEQVLVNVDCSSVALHTVLVMQNQVRARIDGISFCLCLNYLWNASEEQSFVYGKMDRI